MNSKALIFQAPFCLLIAEFNIIHEAFMLKFAMEGPILWHCGLFYDKKTKSSVIFLSCYFLVEMSSLDLFLYFPTAF